MRTRTTLLLATVMLAAAATAPMSATAFTVANPSGDASANAYGMWYAGSAACATVGCHDQIAARETVHGDMITDVTAAPEKLVPSIDLWPAPSPFGGFVLNPADVFLKVGDRNGLLEYAGSESTVLTSVVPAGDLPLWDPVGYEQTSGEWEVPASAVGYKPYGQNCAGCHNLGLTRPSKTTTTLPSGAIQSTDTPTAVMQLSIQCEVCHGTGTDPAASAHTTGVPAVVGGLQILKAQVCGQCHVTGTTPQKNLSNKSFSSPNGYSTDETLTAYLSPASTVPTEGGFAAYLANPTGVTKPSFLPSGANYSMRHSYYNEWLKNSATNGYGHVNPTNTSVKNGTNPKCLGCHSGIGFLNRIGAKYATGALIVTDTPSIAYSVANDVGITCQVCHKGHVGYTAEGGYDLAREWGNGKPVECGDCHNWQFEVLEQAVQTEQIEGFEGVRPAADTRSRHPQREMVSGGAGEDGVNRGMWGVAPMGPYMEGVKCKDCHMPRTHKEGMPADDDGSTTMTRMSHRFHPVLPGDAERWNLRNNGDSCVASCHKEESAAWTRTQFQEWIDATQDGIRLKTGEATATLSGSASALSLSAWTKFISLQPTTGPAVALSAAEWRMAQKAAQNVDIVINDASAGVHQPVYAEAGLDKAQYWADSLLASVEATMEPGYRDGSIGASVSGELLSSRGEIIEGSVVSLEKSTDGGGTWAVSASAVATPAFSFETGPISGPTQFRVTFRPDAGVLYASDVMDVQLPATQIGLDPGAAGSMWVNAASVSATLSSTHADSMTFYALTGATVSAPRVYTGPFSIVAEGTTVISYWSVNSVGSEAVHSQQVRIDRTGPTAASNAKTLYAETAAITASASDAGSGVDYLEYAVDTAAYKRVDVLSVAVPTISTLGPHTLKVRAVDNLGNVGATKTYSFSVKSTPKLTKSPVGSLYTLRPGSTWKYTAVLKRPNGAAVAYKRVYLQRSTNGTTWSTYASLTTGATGSTYKTMSFPARGTTYWRFSSPADTKYNAVNGTATKIIVK